MLIKFKKFYEGRHSGLYVKAQKDDVIDIRAHHAEYLLSLKDDKGKKIAELVEDKNGRN